MVRIDAGLITLIDEGSRRQWVERIDAFLLACHPVTQRLYNAIIGTPPVSGSKPAVELSWLDAIRFCNTLSQLAGLPVCYTVAADGAVHCNWQADGYRLPSEAEWEFACRAGSNEARYGALDEIAWHAGNSAQRLHDVGQKATNDWGLYDMLGNVWEWCWDLYDPAIYGEYRVFRGGGWSDGPEACRASCRRKSHPNFRIDDLGFRLARSLPANQA
ncbi:formylglycine-generating enzyme family protein [Andreprevotia lacus]|nr:SUMF1/EgtB/PvdO family nonheme iron enzyme [Andreprevotia lacus]